MSIEADSRVGNVYALGRRVDIAPGAAVIGFVKASGSIRIAKSARVRDGVLEGVDDALEAFYWTVDLRDVASAPSLAVAAGEKRELAPGVYGTILVRARGELTLRSGDYSIRSLVVEPGAGVLLHNSSGPLQLWLRDELVLRGSMSEARPLSNTLIGLAGASPPELGSSFRGTLVAPRASITVPRTSKAHRGAFLAKQVRISPGAAIVHTPYSRTAHVAPPGE